MKRTITLIITALITQLGFTQIILENNKQYTAEDSITIAKRPQPQTLFNNQKGFGGYFAVNFGYSDFKGKASFISGERIMFVANHYLGIGFGGKGFITNPKESAPPVGADPSITTIYNNTTGAYGGLYLEPVIWSIKSVHIAFPVMLGAGAMVEAQWDNTYWDSGYYNNGYTNSNVSSIFFVAEPGIDVELNIAKWFRIGLGASYRITSKVEGLLNTYNEPMNGFNYNLTFKMGIF